MAAATGALPMSDAQYNFLLEHEGVLLSTIDCDRLADYFHDKQLFKEHHMKEFAKMEGTQRAKQIMCKVRSRGHNAYRLLHDACVEFGHGELAKLLADRLAAPTATGLAAQHNAASGASLGSSRSESPVPSPGRFDLPVSQNSVDINRRYYATHWPHYYAQFDSVPHTAGVLPELEQADVPPFSFGSGIPDLIRTATGLPRDFDEREHYPNFTRPKGLCLIFNNRNFFGPSNEPLPERLGTDTDARNLFNLFTHKLGYECKIKQNLTGSELLNSMARFALKKKHSECDSAIVCFLSHGEDGHIIGTDGRMVPIEDLVKCVDMKHCVGLRGKPKLFFIQACRGKEYDPGHGDDSSDGWLGRLASCFGAAAGDANGETGASNGATRLAERQTAGGGGEHRAAPAMVPSDSQLRLLQLAAHSVPADFPDAQEVRGKLPSASDMLLAYATTPGYVSWRNSAHGSWFVQAVCQIFSQYADGEHVLDMLIKVNRLVAEKFASSGGGFKQIPSPNFQFTRKFFFFPKHYT